MAYIISSSPPSTTATANSVTIIATPPPRPTSGTGSQAQLKARTPPHLGRGGQATFHFKFKGRCRCTIPDYIYRHSVAADASAVQNPHRPVQSAQSHTTWYVAVHLFCTIPTHAHAHQSTSAQDLPACLPHTQVCHLNPR